MSDYGITQWVLGCPLKWFTSYSSVWLLHGWYHYQVKLLTNIHTTMHWFMLSLYLKPDLLGSWVLSCNLPPTLLAEWQVCFTWYCDDAVVEGYWNRSQHRKLTQEKKMLMPGFRHMTSWSQVQCSTTELFLLPTSHLTSCKCLQKHCPPEGLTLCGHWRLWTSLLGSSPQLGG